MAKFLFKICFHFKQDYLQITEYLEVAESQITQRIYEILINELYKSQDLHMVSMIIKHYKKSSKKNIFDLDLPANVYKSIINYLISTDLGKVNEDTNSYSFIDCESKELTLDDYEIC